MRIIHCTQKLLTELKVPTIPAPDILPAKGLGNWYANLLRFNRRKCILFTNEKSIYSFFVPNVVKADMKEFRLLFLVHLCLNLQSEGFSRVVIDRVREEYQEIYYSKTKSRMVLGFMNDFAFEYEFLVYRAGGTDNLRLTEANAKINRTPMHASKREHFYPIEVMRELVNERGHEQKSMPIG